MHFVSRRAISPKISGLFLIPSVGWSVADFLFAFGVLSAMLVIGCIERRNAGYI